MNDSKKEQPVAVCTVCGAFGHSRRYIGERCGKQYGGRRCMGVRGRADHWNDWQQCSSCATTGRQSGEECRSCNGDGWVFVRPEAEVVS